ncbi:MAG: transporter substrate-binding domain-containing protein [Clostridia bacterium]|nr:transporter substrate-binding domain-containing protein [Clostridia bacterium]
MKKLTALLLSALMLTTVAAFTSCGETADETNDVNDQIETEVEGETETETEAETETDADSDWAYVSDNGKLVVGMTLFAPMNYYDDDNNFIGFETEFSKAVAEKLGLEAEFVEIDWTTKEIELAAKSIDVIWNGMTITPERAEAMSITIPYMQNKQVLVAKAENAESYAASVEGLTIVAEAESAGESVATTDDFFASADYVAVDTQAKALMEVSSGTADACVVDFVASIGMIGEGTDYENLVVVATEEFSPEQYGAAFRKGSDITEKVNAAIKELKADGTLDTIAAKYKLAELICVE